MRVMENMKRESVYSQCKTALTGLEIGESKTIEIPENLPVFRRCIIDIGSREGKRFATKTIDGKLRIMRLKYFNISSKEME